MTTTEIFFLSAVFLFGMLRWSILLLSPFGDKSASNYTMACLKILALELKKKASTNIKSHYRSTNNKLDINLS